jgi:hypothetical protein
VEVLHASVHCKEADVMRYNSLQRAGVAVLSAERASHCC